MIYFFDLLAQQAPTAQQSLSSLDAILLVALPAVAALAGSIGKKLGEWTVTTGAAWIETQLKAKKHDEIVPAFDALMKGVIAGADQATMVAVQTAAQANGSADHPHIVAATAQAGAPPSAS